MNPNHSVCSSGYLELIIGPMYSGKTSRLVEVYKQCKFCDIDVVVINHIIDNRYDDELLSTHDQVKIPCIKTDKLLSVISLIDYGDEGKWPTNMDCFRVLESDTILINEGQFFPDLYEFVQQMLSKGKKIYVSGLDGDFERKKFGQILDLIPLCDNVTKLTSLCSLCRDGTRAIFSKRLTQETEQTVVGSDNYIPVCRTCYQTTGTPPATPDDSSV